MFLGYTLYSRIHGIVIRRLFRSGIIVVSGGCHPFHGQIKTECGYGTQCVVIVVVIGTILSRNNDNPSASQDDDDECEKDTNDRVGAATHHPHLYRVMPPTWLVTVSRPRYAIFVREDDGFDTYSNSPHYFWLVFSHARLEKNLSWKVVYEFKVPFRLCVIKLVIRALKPTIKWWILSRVNQGFIRVRSNKNTHKVCERFFSLWKVFLNPSMKGLQGLLYRSVAVNWPKEHFFFGTLR